MPTYLVLIYGDEQVWEAWTPEQQAANGAGHVTFRATAGDAVLGGHELAESRTASSVRMGPDGHQLVTDGPFTESKEVLGGYYLVEAADLDEAVGLARQLPEASAPGSGVEVRSIR
jgi:hypothetical protein